MHYLEEAFAISAHALFKIREIQTINATLIKLNITDDKSVNNIRNFI